MGDYLFHFCGYPVAVDSRSQESSLADSLTNVLSLFFEMVGSKHSFKFLLIRRNNSGSRFTCGVISITNKIKN